jgi:hypothetical protein
MGRVNHEGLSTYRPPMFDGTDYSSWKHRMEVWLKSQDYNLWKVIQYGPFKITKKDDNGNDVPKQWFELTKEDDEKLSCDCKAMNSLFCAISSSEYNRVKCFKTSKEIWDNLELTHEGFSSGT